MDSPWMCALNIEKKAVIMNRNKHQMIGLAEVGNILNHGLERIDKYLFSKKTNNKTKRMSVKYRKAAVHSLNGQVH